MEHVKRSWRRYCSKFSQVSKDLEPLNDSIFDEIWNVVCVHYNEQHRHYHTMYHIASLIKYATDFEDIIENNDAVFFAIIFHDIIYIPKATDNEEQSALLFKTLMSPFLPLELISKVHDYIIATKTHDVSKSPDYDLKLFIDMDMSILGSEENEYKSYAQDIRREYIHVPLVDYCENRGKFLRSMMPADGGTDPDTHRENPVFVTKEFAKLHENMIRNIEWESSILCAHSDILLL